MTSAMKADQAIYGAVNNGHGLRCASGDRRVAVELAHRLDLPDTAPTGAEWSPFVSGFVVRDRYVVGRTFSDTTASRAGMVLTHALICPLEHIVRLNDLRPIFGSLISDPALAPEEVGEIGIEAGSGAPFPAPDLQSAARLLVTRGTGPVVRVGVDGFEELVVSLWAQLWPTIRRGISFRLSFGPNDVVERPTPTIVCTPATLIGRWQHQRIVGQSDREVASSAAMIDGTEAGAGLRQFALSIGAELDSFEALRLLGQAHRFATAKPDAMGELLAAVRLVETLSADPANGAEEKRSLIDRLATVITSAHPAEILTLRNLTLASFATGEEVWHGMERWFEKTNYPADSDIDMIQAVADAIIVDEAKPAWRDAARYGLKKSARKTSDEFPSAFWRWAMQDARIAPALITLVHDDHAAIRRLVESAPSELPPAAAKPILVAAARAKLFDLHAVTAGASMPPLEAAKAQSAIEPGDEVSAMRLALRRAKPTELLDVAAGTNDPRVLRIVAEAVAKTPILLAGRDMATGTSRAIWRDALKVNLDAWRGPSDPRAEFDRLLDELINGQTSGADLVDRLSFTPLADVTAFMRRRELWPKLKGDVRERLLAATADIWFANPDPDVEPELVDCILKDQRVDALFSQSARGEFASGLRLANALIGRDHTRFRRWIGDAVKIRSLSQSDADLLGRSVAARGRGDLVNDLVSLRAGGRRDLDPALRHCTSLMGFWDRIWLGISPVTDADKRESLAQVAAELYPSGPDDNNLWERAGGKHSDLTHHGSGISRWRDALRAIQNGKKPSIASLIQEMRSDFAANPKLRVMADDPLFRR